MRAPRGTRLTSGALRLAAPGLEAAEFALDADQDEKGLSNSMGLFLQKTNIIRDYLEVRACEQAAYAACADAAVMQDIMEEPAPRMFWPKVVWSKCVLPPLVCATRHDAGARPQVWRHAGRLQGASLREARMSCAVR